jgi:hypothetical protein
MMHPGGRLPRIFRANPSSSSLNSICPDISIVTQPVRPNDRSKKTCLNCSTGADRAKNSMHADDAHLAMATDGSIGTQMYRQRCSGDEGM